MYYESDYNNKAFARQFTDVVNEEREAERGNRGKAHPDRYRLVRSGQMNKLLAHAIVTLAIIPLAIMAVIALLRFWDAEGKNGN